MLRRSTSISSYSSQIRRFTTSKISLNSNSLYSFKTQLDDYIYFHSLSSQWRPLVYRQRNADVLTSLNALDKKNHPLVPLKYPGVPSKKKLIKFISLLLTIDEVKILRNSLNELFKIRVTKKKNQKNIKNPNFGKYLEPSIINEFLYKSYELDLKLFNENLIWLDQINENDSIWSVKNTECVAFIRSMIIKTNKNNKNDKINFNSMIEKMQHWIKKSNMKEEGSILYNSSLIIASIYSNVLNENLSYLNNLDKLTRNKVYTVKPNTDYLQYDHAYSIICALKDASNTENASNNEQLKNLVKRWDNFLTDVEKLKNDTPSTYERFLKTEAKKAEELETKQESEKVSKEPVEKTEKSEESAKA